MRLNVTRFKKLELKAVEYIETALINGTSTPKIERALRRHLKEFNPMLKMTINWSECWVSIFM
jgi:hypothetical protein